MKLKALDPILYPIEEDLVHQKSNFINNFFKFTTEGIIPPYAISVDGLWGTGKSTLMSLLSKRLENENYPIFWFNPWEYRQSENIVLAFIQKLSVKYHDEIQDLYETGNRLFYTLVETGANAFLKIVTKGTLSLSDLKDSEKSFKSEKKTEYLIRDYFDIIESLKNEFTIALR